MAQRQTGLSPLELPGWKTALNWLAAFALAVVFLTSGIWKITDAPGAAMRMMEARVPESLSLFAAVGFGIAETVAGALLVVPRFRRWGAILSGLLLTAFLVYFALHYTALRGAECSCFPWVKRVVGPGFFVGDALMLVLAALAGLWSKPPESLRSAVMVLGAVMVFALVSYGVEITRESGTPAPASVTVDGKPYSLQSGRIFVFFFNPQCMHCFEAAKEMAGMQWGDTKVVAVPVEQAQYAGQFLEATGLKAVVTPDFDRLKGVFGYKGYPYGVAVQDGREVEALTKFEGGELGASLKRLGFVK
jgi:uncharacterized membrane protein YphA (DoxX/SURF4 family)